MIADIITKSNLDSVLVNGLMRRMKVTIPSNPCNTVMLIVPDCALHVIDFVFHLESIIVAFQ